MSDQTAFDFVDKMADVRARAAKWAFALGVEMLTAGGMKEDAARAFLGKRIKDIGKPALLRAIVSAAFGEVADPKTYIAAAGRVAPGRNIRRPDDDGDDESAGIQPWMK